MPVRQKEQSHEGALSVSAALSQVKNTLETFTLKVVGEVSELNDKAGYKAVYFTLKDSRASLPCMMWVNRYKDAGVQLRVGSLVEVTGRFTLYAPKGRMNFDVFKLSLEGEGNLRLKVAELAKKLQAEGLMRDDKKLRIPEYPHTIGLVTSPRGAAVHDVLRTLRRRYPLAKVLLAGVPVEGAKAASEMVYALETLASSGAELILLVRGGGSFEDLMPFNDESLSRCIASLNIPVVTGIGHEPDNSIADLVADLRASTPTAAAEAVSPSTESLLSLLDSWGDKLADALQRKVDRQTYMVESFSKRPIFEDPQSLFAAEFQTLDSLEDRLQKVIPSKIERDTVQLEYNFEKLKVLASSLLSRFESEFALAASRLEDLSPLAILARGYSVTRNEKGAVIKSVDSVCIGDELHLDLADGSIVCSANSIQKIDTLTWEAEDG